MLSVIFDGWGKLTMDDVLVSGLNDVDVVFGVGTDVGVDVALGVGVDVASDVGVDVVLGVGVDVASGVGVDLGDVIVGIVGSGLSAELPWAIHL